MFTGGIITAEDLMQYTPVVKPPILVSLANGDYTLYGPPPPSSAAVLGYILNVLDGMPPSSTSYSIKL